MATPTCTHILYSLPRNEMRSAHEATRHYILCQVYVPAFGGRCEQWRLTQAGAMVSINPCGKCVPGYDAVGDTI